MRPSDALPHPEDWPVKPVGQAIEIRRGLSWSKDQEHSEAKDGTVPVLRISNVQKTLDLSDILHISGVPERAKEKKKASKNWCVVVGSNGNRNRIGNAVFVTEDSDFLFASFLIATRPRVDSGIDPRYFFRWLTSTEVQSRMTATAEGSTGLSNLSHDFLKSMEIAVPPIAEQQRIAAILDALDESITRTQEAIERAEDLKRGIVQTLLSRGIGADGKIRPDEPVTFQSSHLGHIPKDWEIVRLRDISDIGSGVTLGKDMSGFSSTELPYLRVANVQDGHLNLNEIKTVEVKTSEVDQYSLKWGDVVLTEGGDFDKLGRGTVWEAQIDPCLHQNHIFRVRPDQARLDPFYLAAVIGAEYGKRYFFRIAKRTTNLASINKTQLRAFPVPVPPLAEQQRIMEAIQGAGSEIERLKDILTQQQLLKRGLMQDLLTGRVRTVPVK